jgi:translation initiation factor 2 subunit 1
MSYYENNYPEINEVVYVKINSVSEHGIYCSLIEYDNKEGFLQNTEMDKKIYYDRKKYFNFTKVYPMLVIDINFDKNHIDLSHSKIKADERDKYIKYFDYLSKIYRLSEEFSKISQLALNDVLPLTMWKFIKKDDIENSQKTFKSILEKPNNFVDHAKELYPTQSLEFVDNLSSRITSTTMTIYKNFNINFYCDNAIDEIKKILDFTDVDTNVKIEYINAPTYRLIVDCKFDFEDKRNIIIEKSIESHNIKMKNGEKHDYIKIIEDICIEEFDMMINLIKERIAGKKINFNLGDTFLAKEREITIKYLQKYEDFTNFI